MSASQRPQKRLILTADDFGLAEPVNEAVEIAHREGVLTAASLMVGGAAAADAVERARRLPTLRVGLHVVLVEGRPLLPPSQVPDLVDARGEFRSELVRAGLRFFFLPGVRRQIEAEIEAQFAAFARTGLALDHVNAHNHMHLHPTVLGAILRRAQRFGARAVRVPYEPPLVSWRAAGRGLGGRLARSLGLGPWTGLVRARLRWAGVRANDWVFGLHDTGAMEEDLLLRLLPRLPDGVTELYFHAASRRCPEIDRTMPGYRHEQELAALTSPRVREALKRHGIQAVAFSDL